MKREGRQHGMVRSYPLLPTPLSHRKFVKTVDSAAAAGIFTKVSRKPTNQSKFTGKCGNPRCVGCHIHPATKSKNKAKGTMKRRSNDTDPQLTDYSVLTSARAYLTNANSYYHDDGDYDDYEGTYDEDYNNVYGGQSIPMVDFMIQFEIASVVTQEHGSDDGDDGWCLVGEMQ